MRTARFRRVIAVVGCLALYPAAAAAWPDADAADSRRMARAKELIADEQWSRAVDELRAAVDDPREKSKDEALFWLAHSLNQENDFAESVEAIRRLEREHPSSRWVKPARSLLIELAQKLKRDDVLWWTAIRTHERPATATPMWPARSPAAPRGTTRRTPEARGDTAPTAWVLETWDPDTDQRIQALGSLIHTDAPRVVGMLQRIALEEKNPNAARRAVFVLAQSGKRDAQTAVVEIAKRGAEPVRIAAVKELGRFGGPDVSKDLLQVYFSGTFPVKRQVVMSLGLRQEAPALLRIAQSEADSSLRASAVVTLGRAGGREQLRLLYARADRASKRPIIAGLFSARAEDELIRIADTERDKELRTEVLSRLRLLGTPKARAYLAKVSP